MAQFSIPMCGIKSWPSFFVSIPTVHLIKTLKTTSSLIQLFILSSIFLFSFFLVSSIPIFFFFIFFLTLSISVPLFHTTFLSISLLLSFSFLFFLNTYTTSLSLSLTFSLFLPFPLFFSHLLAAFSHLHNHGNALWHLHHATSQCSCHQCSIVDTSTNHSVAL